MTISFSLKRLFHRAIMQITAKVDFINKLSYCPMKSSFYMKAVRCFFNVVAASACPATRWICAFSRRLCMMKNLTVLAIVSALCVSALALDLTVFAAASLKESLDENVKAFSNATGHQVRVSYAGSNALAKQIENGAPAQLFISADEAWMDYLAERKLIVASTRKNVLTNELVIVAPISSGQRVEIGAGFPLANALGSGRLALADPNTVPAGKYAKAALQKLNVWQTIESKLAIAENVRAALAFVARGEAPLGIVYRTDALAEPRVRIVATFPAGSHPDIVYPLALVAGQPPQLQQAAQALADALTNVESRRVWQRYGFGSAK
jgi:molybdate transport system substrate-binding protein